MYLVLHNPGTSVYKSPSTKFTSKSSRFWQTFWRWNTISQQSIKKSDKFWQPFCHHGGPHGTKSSIYGSLWTGISVRMSIKYSWGQIDHQKAKNPKTCPGFWGPKSWPKIPNQDLFGKCPEWPQDHF